MLCDELGSLLLCIYNAVQTVFLDDAIVGEVVPPTQKDQEAGIILDITIYVNAKKYEPYDLETKLDILDNLIYNPTLNSEWILSKVNITVTQYGQL